MASQDCHRAVSRVIASACRHHCGHHRNSPPSGACPAGGRGGAGVGSLGGVLDGGLGTLPCRVDPRGVRAGVPGPRVEQGGAGAGRQQQRGSPLDGRDVGGFEDQPALEGDLLAGAAVADADGPDGNVVVADERATSRASRGEWTLAPMSFLVAAPQFVGESGDAIEPSSQQSDAVAVCCQGAGGCRPMPDDAPVTTATLAGVLLLVI